MLRVAHPSDRGLPILKRAATFQQRFTAKYGEIDNSVAYDLCILDRTTARPKYRFHHNSVPACSVVLDLTTEGGF
jgi:hypothetical protein